MICRLAANFARKLQILRLDERSCSREARSIIGSNRALESECWVRPFVRSSEHHDWIRGTSGPFQGGLPILQASADARSGLLPITLANLTGEFLDLANLLADTDPANADAFTEIEECIERSAATIQLKAISIVAMIQEYEAAATAAEAEADRIMAHARAARSRVKWLKDYLLSNLQALGVPRIQTPTMLVAVRKSPPAVEVLDEEQIPDAFKRVVQSLDKSLLRTALMTGEGAPRPRLAPLDTVRRHQSRVAQQSR